MFISEFKISLNYNDGTIKQNGWQNGKVYFSRFYSLSPLNQRTNYRASFLSFQWVWFYRLVPRSFTGSSLLYSMLLVVYAYNLSSGPTLSHGSINHEFHRPTSICLSLEIVFKYNCFDYLKVLKLYTHKPQTLVHAVEHEECSLNGHL